MLVKSHQTAAVAPLAARSAGASGIVATLQNGLGNREILAAASGRPVVAGVTTIGATLLGPGEVRVLAGRVTIGAEPDTEEPAHRLASLLRRAGIEVHTTPDLAPVAWAKLAVNCSVNPLTALAGCPNGALLEDEASREALRAAAREVGAVAAARGIRLLEEPGEWALRMARDTGTNRSSMLQDVERGARTEIDALCGAVSREGRERWSPHAGQPRAVAAGAAARGATRPGGGGGMRLVTTVAGVRDWRREKGGSVGLVPTMGFLHAGHLSLVEAARRENERVAASLFVNPTQFGPHEDLTRYPRDEERDRALLEQAGCDLLFAPSAAEMYPDGFETSVDVGSVAVPLEGERRPGHFRGVATVVLKLFHIATPDRAYFGEKDAQQLAVVRRMVVDLDLPVEVRACPIVRDADGLAMSSRNSYLSPEERRASASLSQGLDAAEALWRGGERRGEALRQAMRQAIAAEPLVRLDYASVACPLTFRAVLRARAPVRLLLAAFVGRTRLIDNRLLD